jgi:hypothetical protein
LARGVPFASLITFCVPFGIYAASAQQSQGFWDVAEMQTVPYILGISHPTGFPLFVLAGWLADHLIPFGSVAWRTNVMSGAAMALAAWCVYATVNEIVSKRWLGVAAALAFGFGDVAWTRGARAEVHAVLIATVGLTLWLIVRWRRTGEDRALLGAALAYGCALATHGLAVLMAPGLALLLFPRVVAVPPRTLLHAAGHLVLPWFLYLLIPLRSAYLYAHRVDPTLSLGLPPGRPFWDGQHPATLDAFLRYMGGGESSAVGGGFTSMFHLVNYPAVAMRFETSAMHEFGFAALVFALLGLALLARSDWRLCLGLVVACAPCIPFGLLYPEADTDRYLLTAFWLCAVLIAVGVSHTVEAYLRRDDALGAGLAVVVAAAIALSLFAFNRADFDGRNDIGPAHLVDGVIVHTPPNAILIAHWAYGTALGYSAYVERRLGDRIVVIGFSGDYKSYYPAWLKKRPIYLVNQEYGDTDFRVTQIWNDPTIVQLSPK